MVSGGKFDGSVHGSLGAAGPVELPCQQEVARYSKLYTTPVRTLSSPVFLSTDSSGRIIEGLGAVPNDQKPILFVGNHQVGDRGCKCTAATAAMGSSTQMQVSDCAHLAAPGSSDSCPST